MVFIDQKSEYICSVFCSGNKASASLSSHLKALEENSLVSSFRLLAKFNYLCGCRTGDPISLLAVSWGPLSTPRSNLYSLPCGPFILKATNRSLPCIKFLSHFQSLQGEPSPFQGLTSRWGPLRISLSQSQACHITQPYCGVTSVKNLSANAGDAGSIPG